MHYFLLKSFMRVYEIRWLNIYNYGLNSFTFIFQVQRRKEEKKERNKEEIKKKRRRRSVKLHWASTDPSTGASTSASTGGAYLKISCVVAAVDSKNKCLWYIHRHMRRRPFYGPSTFHSTGEPNFHLEIAAVLSATFATVFRRHTRRRTFYSTSTDVSTSSA